MDKVDQLIFIFPIVLLIIGIIIGFQKNKAFSNANKAFNKGEYEKALTLYKNIVKKNKNHKIAYFNIGKIFENLKRYDEALKTYDEVIKIDKNFIDAYIRKLDILRQTDKYEETLKTYGELNIINKEINNKEADKLVCFSKGIILSDKLQRYEEALQEYNEAIKIDPYYKEALRAKGTILHYHLSKYEEALETYNNILEIDEESIRTYLDKSLILGTIGKHKEAILILNKVLINYDKRIKNKENQEISNIAKLDKGLIYYSLAIEYSLTNNLTNAINNLKEAIIIDPERKEEAKKDSSFDSIKNSNEFKKIIGD